MLPSEKTIFGEDLENELFFKLSYKGNSFNEGKIKIDLLVKELESLESILRRNIEVLVSSGQLEKKYSDLDVFIRIESGSILEKINIVFNKKNVSAAVLFIILDIISQTYGYFLNYNKNGVVDEQEYRPEVLEIVGDKKIREDIQNLLEPLGKSGDKIVIEDNNGNINFFIDSNQKVEIIESIKKVELEENEVLKEGDFVESAEGIIRKLDLDATAGNFFGFNIKGGQSKIPTRFKKEFNLNDMKKLIDVDIKITGNFRYKQGKVSHIEIDTYEIVNEQKNIDF